MTVTVLWFRRDLRLSDNPALVEAVADADEVVPLFCLDDRLRRPAGSPRVAYLYRSLRVLDESIDGALVVRAGAPARVVAEVAAEVGAERVHCAEDFGPYGRRRDDAVAKSLAGDGRELVPTGSAYAVPPGSVRTGTGQPYKVFTPFAKAWRVHGWPDPVGSPATLDWATGVRSDGVPDDPDLGDVELPRAGEEAAGHRLDHFLRAQVDGYADCRDVPGAEATSRLSPDLKWGAIHPRQVLARLGRSKGEDAFRSELAWREFYADVLFHRPDSAWESLDARVGSMATDDGRDADERFAAWAEGRTGYPIVDAGMRQLLAEGWMHNRVRMIVASFLVKDLHLPWQRGAAHFMTHLVDGDLASNQHGWQWTAGTGTDAAPYFRVFNPTMQGRKFDPDGAYVRRYLPELAGVDASHVHQPWTDPAGVPLGYCFPIVDHTDERDEALRRYEAVRR